MPHRQLNRDTNTTICSQFPDAVCDKKPRLITGYFERNSAYRFLNRGGMTHNVTRATERWAAAGDRYYRLHHPLHSNNGDDLPGIKQAAGGSFSKGGG